MPASGAEQPPLPPLAALFGCPASASPGEGVLGALAAAAARPGSADLLMLSRVFLPPGALSCMADMELSRHSGLVMWQQTFPTSFHCIVLQMQTSKELLRLQARCTPSTLAPSLPLHHSLQQGGALFEACSPSLHDSESRNAAWPAPVTLPEVCWQWSTQHRRCCRRSASACWRQRAEQGRWWCRHCAGASRREVV